MSELDRATARPWVCTRSRTRTWYIYEKHRKDNGYIMACWEPTHDDHVAEANAKLIVRAVNNFGALIEILRDLIAAAGNPSPELLKRAAAVLAASEGGYDLDKIHAVLAKAATASPDYIYDPSDWETTYHWLDRHLLVEGMDAGDVREFRTLYDGPSKWCAVVGIDPDEDGFASDTEVRWFDNEADARAAVDITKGGDNG